MQLDTSTLMMIFFIIFLLISLWKISAFLPNKQLEDDDTTQESQNELLRVMLLSIKKLDKDFSADALYICMVKNENFDKERFWRFNKNKLNKLLETYYLNNPHITSIEDISKSLDNL
jgi:hypothetical protein